MKNVDKLIAISFFLSFASFYAQNKKEKNEILLDFALCDCLHKKWAQVDSTIVLNDVSLSVYMNQYNFISYEMTSAIDSMINSFEVSGNGLGSHTSSQVSNSNQIFKECSEFIKSKTLEIKRLID
jgi:hypothetical protein